MDSKQRKDRRGDQQAGCYDIDSLRVQVDEDPGAPEYPALAEAERRAGDAAEARRISEAGLEQAPGRMAGRVSLGLALLDLGELDAAREALGVILDTVLEPHRLQTAAAADEHQATPIPVTDDRGVFDVAVDDAEVSRAIMEAASQTEEMHSANRMAEDVLLAHAPADEAIAGLDAEGDSAPLVPVEGDASEGEPSWHAREPIASHEASTASVEQPFEVESSPAFATETMANLLEQQGDHSGARLIRQSLGVVAAEGAGFEAVGPMDAALVPESKDLHEPGSDREESRQKRILAVLQSWLHNLQRGVP